MGVTHRKWAYGDDAGLLTYRYRVAKEADEGCQGLVFARNIARDSPTERPQQIAVREGCTESGWAYFDE